ncbi:MAG: hypothetical protein N4A74_09630 [Carboxylicivirga sp.]|nr:hypothetical protein [Carboxylicivirga sp.]
MRPAILFFLLLLSVKSYSQNANIKQINSFHRLSIGSLNDSYNGAFVLNRDDHRTMGFDLRYNNSSTLLIEASYSGMTNRSPGNPLEEGRLDELLFRSNYKVFEKHRIKIYPTLGFILSGDLGGENLQNSVHEDVDEPLVFLPYDYESVRIAALAGVNINHLLPIGKSRILSLNNELDFYHATNYSSWLNIGSGLIYGRPEANYFTFSISYQKNNIFVSTSGKAVSRQESGLKLSFSQSISFLSLGYDIFPANGYGYGRIAINLLNTGDQNNYENHGLSVDFKALTDRGGYYSNYKIPFFKLIGHSVNASLGYAYGTYTANVIPSHPNARGQYWQSNLGLESYLVEIRPKFQVNPYFGFGLGYKNESTFSGDDATLPTLHSGSPLSYFEGGIRIGGPLNFISRSTLIGLLIGDIYSLPFSPKEQLVHGHLIKFLKPDNQFYLGFNFSIDL